MLRFAKRRAVFGAALFCALTTAAASADVVSRQFDVRAGGTLEIDTDLGKIDIRTGNTGQVDIEVIRGGDRGEELELEFEQDGDRIRVKGDYPRSDNMWNWRGNRARVEFKVRIPRQFNVDLDTEGGSIEVDDLDGTLDARTSGGSLEFGQIQGRVKARTSGGSISLDGAGADVDVNTSGGSISVGPVYGEVRAHTSGGSIRIREVAGAVEATTSGGSVEATMTTQPTSDCKLSTSGGSVTLNMADGIAVDIDATAGGGGVRSDFPIDGKTKDKRSLRGSVNGGGPRVRLSTSGGGVRIRSLR